MVSDKKVKLKRSDSFYSRKIGKAGGTRTLSVGNILPRDWQVVKVTVKEFSDRECILRIERLV